MNLPNIRLEKVRCEEIVLVEQLLQDSFGEKPYIELVKDRLRLIKRYYHLLRPFSRFSQRLSSMFSLYLIKLNELPIGFCQISWRGRNNIYLDFIVVREQYRGCGVASWVLKNILIEYAARCSCGLALEVQPDNKARLLYEHLGFEPLLNMLCYERKLNTAQQLPQTIQLKFRRKSCLDAGLRHELYYQNIPWQLLKLAESETTLLQPSMFQRHIDKVKHILQGSDCQTLAVSWQQRIIAVVELRGRYTAGRWSFGLYLLREFELLRTAVISQILKLLHDKYRHGTVSTTIYNDLPTKQTALEQLGFSQTDQYILMYRASKTENWAG